MHGNPDLSLSAEQGHLGSMISSGLKDLYDSLHRGSYDWHNI